MPCMHRLGAHHPFLPSMHSLRCPQPNYPPRPCMCRPGQHPACPPASPHSCGSPAPSIALAHLRCNAPLFARRPVRHTGPLVLHFPRHNVVPRRLHPHLRRPLRVHRQWLLWLMGKPHVRSPVVHGRDRVQSFRPKPQAGQASCSRSCGPSGRSASAWRLREGRGPDGLCCMSVLGGEGVAIWLQVDR